jgi:hypothetical protein
VSQGHAPPALKGHAVKILFSSSVGSTGNVVFVPGALGAGSGVGAWVAGSCAGAWVSADNDPAGYVGRRLWYGCVGLRR